MNLYISDLHFGHKNVIVYDHRSFVDVDEMDHVLIELWNARVCNDDHVYIVGDLCYKNDHPEQWYLRQLKGRKHLVIGNHDSRLLKNEEAMAYFESVEPLMRITDGDKDIVLCHYPLACWNGEEHGSWHIYGHIHGKGRMERYAVAEYMRGKERALNAGCMINNYTPASLNELIVNNKRYWEQ